MKLKGYRKLTVAFFGMALLWAADNFGWFLEANTAYAIAGIAAAHLFGQSYVDGQVVEPTEELEPLSDDEAVDALLELLQKNREAKAKK